jgi:hypothetical protein
VSENSQLLRYYQNKRYLFDSSTVGDKLENWILEPSQHLHAFSIIRMPRTTSSENAVAMYSHILMDPQCQSVFSPQAVGGFFPFIPERLGLNEALDAAIPCLYGMYGDLLAGRNASATTMQGYVTCLGALRRCIVDPVLRMQSETLCASLIVQIFEVRSSAPIALSSFDFSTEPDLF